MKKKNQQMGEEMSLQDMHEKSTRSLELGGSCSQSFCPPCAFWVLQKEPHRRGRVVQRLLKFWGILGSGPNQSQAVLCVPSSAVCSLLQMFQNSLSCRVTLWPAARGDAWRGQNPNLNDPSRKVTLRSVPGEFCLLLCQAARVPAG